MNVPLRISATTLLGCAFRMFLFFVFMNVNRSQRLHHASIGGSSQPQSYHTFPIFNVHTFKNKIITQIKSHTIIKSKFYKNTRVAQGFSLSVHKHYKLTADMVGMFDEV